MIAAGGPGIIGESAPGIRYRQVLLAFALPRPGEVPVDLSQFAPLPAPQQTPAGKGTSISADNPPPTSPGIAGIVNLPAGTGREDFLSMCGQCHDISTADQMRRGFENASREKWTRQEIGAYGRGFIQVHAGCSPSAAQENFEHRDARAFQILQTGLV